MANVDLTAVRQRLADPPVLPKQEDAPKVPKIRPETLAEVERYTQEVAEQAKRTEKVDLGPLPEGVEAPDQKDRTYYRDTASDNKRVRQAIEKKCGEMDFADLVLTGRVKQTVPVLAGKITFEFQSLTGTEDFWIESNAQLEASTEWGVRSWVVYARLTMALVAVNGKVLSSHLDKSGQLDAKLFQTKMKEVLRLGSKILDIAVTNMGWFNNRVEQIFQDDFEALGNG